jgi:small subunit ribosomal protein S6
MMSILTDAWKGTKHPFFRLALKLKERAIDHKEVFLMLRKYEALLLLNPELANENRKEIVDGVVAIIEREGGKLDEIDDWGSRQLAYPVQNQSRGYYVRVVFDAPAPVVAELERNIRITDGIFKFVTVKLEDHAKVQEEA